MNDVVMMMMVLTLVLMVIGFDIVREAVADFKASRTKLQRVRKARQNR